MPTRWLAFVVAAPLLLLPSVTSAATAVHLYAPLGRAVENAASSPGGSGLAVISINADRNVLTYRITFTGVTHPVTRVAFCVGQAAPPTIAPIPGPCAFSVVPASEGGPSPIVGSVSILPSRFAVITGYGTFIELDSASGREIRGYLAAGEPPATATVAGPVGAPDRGPGPLAPLILRLAGGTVFVWRLRASQRTRSA